MVIEINSRSWIFRTKEIWFGTPSDSLEGFSRIRINACPVRASLVGFETWEFSTIVMNLHLDLDQIWRGMDRKSCRYEIKRGYKVGVRIRRSNSRDDWARFIELNNRFRKTKGLPPQQGLSIPAKFLTLFISELDGMMLGGQVYISDSDCMRMLIASSVRLNADLETSINAGCGNRMMVWEAIRYAKSKNISEFDLGGYHIGSDPELTSVNAFKGSFGGRLALKYYYARDTPAYRVVMGVRDALRGHFPSLASFSSNLTKSIVPTRTHQN